MYAKALQGGTVLALILILPTALAQAPAAYPVKPVRVVVPVPPGGLQDTFARGAMQELSRLWGQPGLVENRPGAGGIPAADAVAKSAPDGYTLFMADQIPLTVTPFVNLKLPFDPVKDLVGVVGLVRASSVLIAPPAAPFNSLQELVAVARSKTGELNYGSFGPGSANHLTTERFARETGIKLVHVPYKGGADVIRAVAAGEVHFSITGLTAALPLIKQGRVKAIAWSGARRSPALPDVPTMSEGLRGFEQWSWFGWFAPAGTPRAIVERIAADAGRVIAVPEFQAKFITGVGLEPFHLGPDQLSDLVRSERVRNGELVKSLKLTVN